VSTPERTPRIWQARIWQAADLAGVEQLRVDLSEEPRELVLGHHDRGVVKPLAQQSCGVGLRADLEVGADLLDDAGDPFIVSRLQGALFHRVVPHVIRHASMLAPTAPAAKACRVGRSASARAGAVNH
jgi:hypothetical protein